MRGSSPFALDARNAEVDLASWRWAVALADVRLGEGESITRFAADRITGRPGAGGMTGDLVGASGKIGAVPLNMSEIAGRWRYAGGALTLDGGLLLTWMERRWPDIQEALMFLITKDRHLEASY